MQAEPVVLFESRDGVAWITLNRPRVLNAYNVQMRDELYEALGMVADDPEVRVAVIRGAGDRAFCAGADLTEFGSAPSQAIARRVRFERDVWGRFLDLRKPVIAAIHGFCFGSGLEIALCCDLRIAAENAVFGLPETALGMIPAAAGTQTYPRVAGRSRALAALLTGDRMDARHAAKAGLVNRIVQPEDLLQVARAAADMLSGMDAAVVQAVKQSVTRGMDTGLEEGLRIEGAIANRLAADSKNQ